MDILPTHFIMTHEKKTPWHSPTQHLHNGHLIVRMTGGERRLRKFPAGFQHHAAQTSSAYGKF